MSLLNAWIEPSRAVLATDTATQAQHGGRSHMSKVLALPHLGAVVATIGNNDLCGVFMYTLGQVSDFDAFLDDASKLLNESVRFYESRAGLAMRDAQAVTIAGWSHARGRAVGVYGERQKRGQSLDVREIEGTLVCPGWPEYTHRELSTDAAMIDAAKAQVAYVNGAIPECPIGGRLILAEVTREAVAMRDAGAI